MLKPFSAQPDKISRPVGAVWTKKSSPCDAATQNATRATAKVLEENRGLRCPEARRRRGDHDAKERCGRVFFAWIQLALAERAWRRALGLNSMSSPKSAHPNSDSASLGPSRRRQCCQGNRPRDLTSPRAFHPR